MRVDWLRQARSLEQIRQKTDLGFHSLTGHLAGMYAVRLGYRKRLLLTFDEPDTLWIEEVSDHYE